MTDGLELKRRRADREDSDWWLSLRNEESVRASSFNTDIIDAKSHSSWFEKRLSDGDERLYIYELCGERVAQLRLSRGDDGVYISYAVEKEHRGRGIGKRVLKDAAALAAEELGEVGLPVVGMVKDKNAASAAAFEALGFELKEKKDGARRYEMAARIDD